MAKLREYFEGQKFSAGELVGDASGKIPLIGKIVDVRRMGSGELLYRVKTNYGGIYSYYQSELSKSTSKETSDKDMVSVTAENLIHSKMASKSNISEETFETEEYEGKVSIERRDSNVVLSSISFIPRDNVTLEDLETILNKWFASYKNKAFMGAAFVHKYEGLGYVNLEYILSGYVDDAIDTVKSELSKKG